jgi:hypothetical protein
MKTTKLLQRKTPMPQGASIKRRSRRKPTSMVRSTAITQSANGQTCTLQIVGQSCAPDETVVLAHIPLPGNHGTALKPDDLCAAYACATCHDLLDGRVPGLKHGSADWLFYALRGMARTLRILHDTGIIVVNGKLA